MFRMRKNRLEDITKANKLIHEKINEMGSYYPQKRTRGGKTTALGSLNDLQFKSKEIPCKRDILGPISRFEGLKMSNNKFELFMDGKPKVRKESTNRK